MQGIQGASLFQGSSTDFSQKFDPSVMDKMKYVIYILAIAIAVFVVVLIADNFFPFLPVNPLGGPSAAARAGKKFWTNITTESENLIVPASMSPTVVANSYSMTVQLMIGDSRTPSAGRFRHILHRGSNPCSLSSSVAGPSGHAGIQIGDIPDSADPSYKNTGLPAVMNPGLFLDKYRNDLHVFVHTRGKEAGADVLWLESVTIADVPLRTPTTVGVVCNGRTLEVYFNCRLYSTLILKGDPYLPTSDNQWYGRYCAFPMSGIVKDLQLWGAPLNSSDYMSMCRNVTFNNIDLPDVCSANAVNISTDLLRDGIDKTGVWGTN
jgi:hypothetical protein